MTLGSIFRNGIWIAAAALAFLAPRFGESLWRTAEELLRRFAERKFLCCVSLVLLVMIVRAAFLPVWGIPKPFVHDEYAYLLEADTFASGRLANPTHPLSDFFERAFVLQRPTYAGKYPPGQGLIMAAGEAITGEAWLGVWLSCGLLAAAICWALQGWFSPGWAVFGSVLALPLCTFSYWMDSYWGGAVAAIGGALVFGALPRISAGSPWFAAILGVGSVILSLTRPFEGALALAPVVIAAIFRKPTFRQYLAFAIVAAAGVAFLGYYNFRVTGNALRLPYSEYDAQHSSTGHFNISPLPPQIPQATFGLTWIDQWERISWKEARTAAFFPRRVMDLVQCINSFLGSWLLLIPLALFWPALFAERRFTPILCALGLVVATSFLELSFFEHYAAPVLIALLILVVEGARHFSNWEPKQGLPAGRLLIRAAPVIVLLLALLDPLAKLVRGYPMGDIRATGDRERIEQGLKDQFGEHVIFVRYTKTSATQAVWSQFTTIQQMPVLAEWVANGANIDDSPVIWAHDRGPQENRRVLDYYKGRTFWLFKPEEGTGRLEPYQFSR